MAAVRRTACLGLLTGVLGGLALAAPGAPQNTPMSGGAPPLPDAEPPAVARDIGVAELPLLVTEPPAAQAEPEIPAPVTGGVDSTLNPFSPLLLPQPQGAAEPLPPTPPPLAADPPPSAPPAEAAETPAPLTPAPAPRARLSTPSTPTALSPALSALMQPSTASSSLSTGNLSTSNLSTGDPSTGNLNTSILKRPLGAGSTPASNPLAETAAVRVPSSLAPLGSVPAASGALTPLGLAGGDGYATANRVSRSLSERRVAFTAMVTGTGIFRVGDSAAPVLVAVGERLPGTELVLSRLTNSSAQFSEDDARHTLSLNP